jgi:hypothetical protein
MIQRLTCLFLETSLPPTGSYWPPGVARPWHDASHRLRLPPWSCHVARAIEDVRLRRALGVPALAVVSVRLPGATVERRNLRA